jgi:hypothetical protein
LNVNDASASPATGLARVDPAVLDLGLADVQVRDDVTVQRDVLTDEEPEEKMLNLKLNFLWHTFPDPSPHEKR